MSPEQEIRIKIRTLLNSLGYPVLNFIPDPDKEFPMIHVGEQFKQNERLNIDGLNGSTQVTIHIWHNNLRQEGTVMKISNQVEHILLKEFKTNGENITTELLMDDSTGVQMLHGIINVSIKY